jgi:hypothetical protein
VTVRVLFVAPPGPEEDEAWRWLASRPECAAKRVAPSDLPQAIRDTDVVWVHLASAPEGVPADRLAGFAARGNVLLTLRAASLIVGMGIEPVPPNEDGEARWRHDADPYWTGDLRSMPGYPHVRGLATYGPHPLVDDLHNGTYCWAPSEGERYAWCCYAHGARPARGRVVGVERAYIAQVPDRVVAWEYPELPGGVLCLGAFVHFAAPDALLRPQLERLLLNALTSPTRPEAVHTWWPEPGTGASPSDALPLPEPLDLDGALPESADDPIAWEIEPAGGDQFDLAGRRALLVGREREGIRELWMHPHRLVASWDVAADGEPAVATRVVATPDVVTRELETSRRRIGESSFVALEHPFALVEYHALRRRRESVGVPPAALEITLALDLRRMWPFVAGCGGPLRFRMAQDGRTLLVVNVADDAAVGLFVGRPATLAMRAVSMREAQGVEIVVRAPLELPLRIAVVGGSGSLDFAKTLATIRRLGLSGLVRQRLQRATVMREARLSARGPDERTARALEWAKRRLDLFVGDVPGLGRSLLAGYAASRPGWNEARPGYAWFFGRDAVWTAFAMLALGEHALVRQVLRFLSERQDVSGKVLHEATTSGQFHYDAADSTPLYLLLVSRYLDWTGDVEFVRRIWPRVRRAFAFCLATDTDGDGLIENTRVGHGWIEGGPLGGAHVSLYLAAIWHAALAGLARTAEAAGDGAFGEECRERAERAREAIRGGFYDERRGIYALDRRRDGARTWTQTALQSVAVLLGAADAALAGRYLDQLAGEGFSAAWGVRMLPTSDTSFRGSGYHSGSVWPLYTGWASLAEYRAGRPEAAFRHLGANLALPALRQKGAFDEVLHGLTGEAAGVCPDQAWSAALTALPLVEGMLGAVADAPHGRLSVAPALPEAWDWLEVRGLRCGETVYDVKVRRRPAWLDIGVRRTSGPALWITVAPWLSAAPARVEVDGNSMQPQAEPWGRGVCCPVSFQAAAEHSVQFYS